MKYSNRSKRAERVIFIQFYVKKFLCISKRQAAAKAEDLHQNGIEIELMSMNRPSHNFDDDLFYKDILFTDDDENTVRPDPADKFEELLSK